jgi:hypothetical protein
LPYQVVSGVEKSVHFNMVGRREAVRGVEKFLDLRLAQRLLELLILVLHLWAFVPSVWEGIVRIVLISPQETTGLVMRRQLWCVLGELLNSLIGGLLFYNSLLALLTPAGHWLIFSVHYLFEVGGVDEVVYVAVGVGDDRVFRREPPFSVNDELILMKTSGELLR